MFVIFSYFFISIDRQEESDTISTYWVIPENIHTIPRAASWNSEGEGGFLGLEFRRRGGVTQFGIPKAWGGVSALNSVNFQRKDGESSA